MGPLDPGGLVASKLLSFAAEVAGEDLLRSHDRRSYCKLVGWDDGWVGRDLEM